MDSFSSGHGHLKWCLVHYYPDAFYFFNKIASWGSYVSGFSVIIFIWVLIDAFLPQNKLKVCVASNSARFFSSNGTTSGPKNSNSIKTYLFDKFLKYQFTICTEPNLPLSHVIPLFVLSCIVGSGYYIALYWVSILFILSTLHLADMFPDSFGSKYLSFLKRHSSTEAFEKYCGNPWGALKATMKDPERFLSIATKYGLHKVIVSTGLIIAGEHSLHQSKVGQIYEYKMDEYLNGGKHSSGKPFSFKPNGQSILDKVIDRNGK
jgi:hypothetical protein